MLGTQEGTRAVQAGFPEEAALESNLKEAQPMEQRDRVPVSIPTFPGGRGSVFLAPIAGGWLTSREERQCF